MTRAEALAEAVKRWGDCGEPYAGEFSVVDGTQFLVGYWRSRKMNHIEVRGSGDSYEAAFGAHHLWPEVQSGKMAEHLCRRILAPDQVVRARMEKEITALREMLDSIEWVCADPDGGSPLFCPRCDAEKEPHVGVPEAGHLPDCPLAALLRRGAR